MVLQGNRDLLKICQHNPQNTAIDIRPLCSEPEQFD